MANLFKKKYLNVPHLSVFNFLKEIGKNPFVDWVITVFITTALSVAFVAGGIYLYLSVSSGKIKSDEVLAVTGARAFDKAALSSVLDYFEAKDAAYTQAKKGYIGVKDPSI